MASKIFKLILITVLSRNSWCKNDNDGLMSLKNMEGNNVKTTAANIHFWKSDRNAEINKSMKNKKKPGEKGKMFFRQSRLNQSKNWHNRVTRINYEENKVFTKIRPIEVENTTLKYHLTAVRNGIYSEGVWGYINRMMNLKPKDLYLLRNGGQVDKGQIPKILLEKTVDDIASFMRMPPTYMRQQANYTGHSRKELSEDFVPERLNPYSLLTQMRRILSEFPQVNATIEVIDRTVEYNNILLIKMSEQTPTEYNILRSQETKYVEDGPEKKIVFIVHGLSVMGIYSLSILSKETYLKQLLAYYIAHLDKFDIFLMPMANPDGYAAEAVKTFWNKNMSPQSACLGVALDRNFDVAWNNEKGYSSCSQLYPGPSPFSEVESRAVREVLHQYGLNIFAYIHAHSGTHSAKVFKGDAVLYPKGYSAIHGDDDKYIDLRSEIDDALRNASFHTISVTVETLFEWYGKVGGTSVDYASTVYGIPYAMEFAMQLYTNDVLTYDTSENMDHNALTDIWQRVINVVFNSMWNKLRADEVK